MSSRARAAAATLAVLHPEKRIYPAGTDDTGETAIRTTLLADLYVALGDDDGKGGATIRAYWKPLVPWIWIGAVMMALGGVLSLSDRRWRVGVGAPAFAGGRRHANRGSSMGRVLVIVPLALFVALVGLFLCRDARRLRSVDACPRR